MKIRHLKFFLSLMLLFATIAAYSQIGMRIVLNRKVFMQYEPVYACVTIKNNTGRVLAFGNDPRLQGFVYFIVTDSKGRRVPKIEGKEISVLGLTLKPGEERNMVIAVNDYYNLDTPGIYTVNACVAHNMLPHEYVCREDRSFMIDTGVEIWSQVTGVPDLSDSPDAARPAKERKYGIRLLTEPPDKHYYLFVEDEKMVYGVARIGKKIGTEKFSAEVDMLGRIHLLIPLGAKVFHYLTYSIDGVNTSNTYWKTSDTIPMLYRDPKNGIVSRLGGVEAKRGVDYLEYQGTPASKLLNKQPAPLRNEGLSDLNQDISLTGNDATD